MVNVVKREFSAGEITPYLTYRTDSERNVQGCTLLQNQMVVSQGITERRPGTQFVYDQTSLMGDTTSFPPVNDAIDLDSDDDPDSEIVPVRLIPFIFNELQAFTLCFFNHTAGATVTTRFCIYSGDGIVESTTNPGTPYVFEINNAFDLHGFSYAQSGDKLYVAQGGRKPLVLTRNTNTDWDLDEINFTDEPTEWSSINGYPEFVSFYEQRLVFASNTFNPRTIWFSKAGAFTDFGESSPIQDDDSITLTIDSGQQNKIQWMSSSQKLLVGTLEGEWAVGGTGGNPITPLNLSAIKQTNQGGEKLIPVPVGPVTLFLERFGKVVNQIAFDFNFNGYNVVDLSILSPHLTKSTRINFWSFQKGPDQTLWCVLNDGKMLGLTYKREHGVLAWSRHVTEGSFMDVCCIPGNNQTETWVLARRRVEGNYKLYVEKLAPRFPENITRCRHLDSHVKATNLTPPGDETEVTGLDHLEGEIVHIYADGTQVPPQLVENGKITIKGSFPRATIGLPFTSKITPILPELSDREGSSIGRVRNVESVHLLLENSRGMHAEVYTHDNKKTVKAPVPLDIDTPSIERTPSGFSGIARVEMPGHLTESTEISIVQETPFPLTLLGLTYRVEIIE